MIREANKNDLDEILELYLNLHETSIPEDSDNLRDTWNQMINDTNHHLIVNVFDNKIVASCVCVIIPNLTRNVRPYNQSAHQLFSFINGGDILDQLGIKAIPANEINLTPLLLKK